MTPRQLLQDIAVERAGEGRYTADLPEAWSFFKPSGGVLMSIGLNAMRAEVGDPEMRIVSATSVFCTPVGAGRLEIEVRMLRKGTAASQVAATVQSDPKQPGIEITATFARARSGYPDVVEADVPDVPPPDGLEPAPANPKYPMRFFENFEHRLAYGHFSWETDDWTPGDARYVRWLRYRVPPRVDGLIDPLAFPPILDLMPPALVHKVGKKGAGFFAPSLDLTVHFYGSTKRDWLMVSGLCRRAEGGTASAQVELFDDEGALLAYATQVMILKRTA